MAEPRPSGFAFSPSRLLALIACVCFILSAFAVNLGAISLLALGLAFLAASFVV